MKKKVLYEHPLNERIRILLRLEYLFEHILYRIKGPSEWDSRAVINSIIEILDLTSRVDFKAELIKDLEYHTQILEQWQSLPDVDNERLNKLINKTGILIDRLNEVGEVLGEKILQHKLINIIKQRRNIAGGTSSSDLPAYYHWLQKYPKRRQDDLAHWLEPFEPLRDAIDLNLYLIRSNAMTTPEIASGGFFQSKLDSPTNTNYHIIQVLMPIVHPCYPEISGGKQRFTIRFFETNTVEERPLQTQQDINFELRCCMV